jgi:hypothetical protein
LILWGAPTICFSSSVARVGYGGTRNGRGGTLLEALHTGINSDGEREAARLALEFTEPVWLLNVPSGGISSWSAVWTTRGSANSSSNSVVDMD